MVMNVTSTSLEKFMLDLFCLKIMCLHVNKLKVSEVFLECVRHQRRSVGKLSSTKSTLRVSPAPSGEGMLALIAQLFIRSAISSFSSDLRRFSSSSSSSRKIEWNQWYDQEKTNLDQRGWNREWFQLPVHHQSHQYLLLPPPMNPSDYEHRQC